jgi:hypothetical protein
MSVLEKNRIHLAILFQAVFLFFLLFPAYTEARDTQHRNDHSKALLCVSPGNSIAVRETSEQLSSGLSPIKNNSILTNEWLWAAWTKLLELVTNPALQISNRIYNPFYLLPTIHAP